MLQVKDLVKHFDGIKAVDGVSFEVSAGECVALIGPNGAGKSTCFACIAGQYKPTSGQMVWDAQALNKLSPADRLQHGVARTFQVAQVFEALTVQQNVQLAVQARDALRNSGEAVAVGSGWAARRLFAANSTAIGKKNNAADRPNPADHRPQGVMQSIPRQARQAISAFKNLSTQSREAAYALLEKTGLETLAEREVLSLPYGAKKRLELAVALAGRPGLLLLDEPAAGLAEQERAHLMHLVRGLAAQGMAVLYTEHNMDAVAGVAGRVLVLIEGRLAAQGSFEDISRNPIVRKRYLGEGLAHGA